VSKQIESKSIVDLQLASPLYSLKPFSKNEEPTSPMPQKNFSKTTITKEAENMALF
jgi:hypothetical protein